MKRNGIMMNIWNTCLFIAEWSKLFHFPPRFITVLKIKFYPLNEKKNCSNCTARRVSMTSSAISLEPRQIRRIHVTHHPTPTPPPPFCSLRMEAKGKGRREHQQQHKKLLAAMLSQDSFDSALNSSVSSVAEDEMEDEDDTMELLGKFASSRHACQWSGSVPTIV